MSMFAVSGVLTCNMGNNNIFLLSVLYSVPIEQFHFFSVCVCIHVSLGACA